MLLFLLHLLALLLGRGRSRARGDAAKLVGLSVQVRGTLLQSVRMAVEMLLTLVGAERRDLGIRPTIGLTRWTRRKLRLHSPVMDDMSKIFNRSHKKYVPVHSQKLSITLSLELDSCR